jgi:hypothetical protein
MRKNSVCVETEQVIPSCKVGDILEASGLNLEPLSGFPKLFHIFPRLL